MCDFYKFATDSMREQIVAEDWNDACQQLVAMLPDEAIDDGGWGWVEDGTGQRFAINCEGDTERGM